MSAYQRVTCDEYEVQGYYLGGWEVVHTAETWSEARGILRDYLDNEPGVLFRIVKHRVRLEGADKR